MPSRPWPIRILSTLLIIAPLTNTLIAAWFWEVPLGLYLSTVFSQSWITVVELLIPLPLAGYCIYRMRTWSYFTAFGILSLVVLRSIQNGLTMNKIYGGWALAIFLVINLLVIGYLLVPRVRKIYFDARLRWWEALPRFSFDQPVLLSDSIGTVNAASMNISRGGMLLRVIGSPAISQTSSKAKFSLSENSRFDLAFRVVHRTKISENSEALGIQFLGESEADRLALKNLAKALKQSELKLVRQPPPLKQDFLNWIRSLIPAKTAK